MILNRRLFEGDERLRSLERAAATGDPEAKARLHAARVRSGAYQNVQDHIDQWVKHARDHSTTGNGYMWKSNDAADKGAELLSKLHSTAGEHGDHSIPGKLLNPSDDEDHHDYLWRLSHLYKAGGVSTQGRHGDVKGLKISFDKPEHAEGYLGAAKHHHPQLSYTRPTKSHYWNEDGEKTAEWNVQVNYGDHKTKLRS